MSHLKCLLPMLIVAIMAVGCQGTSETPPAGGSTPIAPVPPRPRIEPPAVIVATGKSKGEAPYRNFHVDITLTNRRDTPQWFVLPYYGDEPLPKDDMFRAVSEKVMPFESYRFDGSTTGGKGTLTRIGFLGTKKFIAFRAKPKATIRIRDLAIPSKRLVSTVPVWEARKILVNSDVALEKYLPYATYSSAETDVPKKTPGARLDLKDKGTTVREDFPRKGVDHIWIITHDKWDIKVKEKK